MTSRRMQRMSRNKGKPPSLSLTSLMDVFTILVLYLLVNQGTGGEIDPPKSIKLPDSVVETSPRQTVILAVASDQVLLQGKAIMSVQEVLEDQQDYVESIRQELLRTKEEAAQLGVQFSANRDELTILADREVPFKVLKKLMSTGSSAGYIKISLAVNLKDK